MSNNMMELGHEHILAGLACAFLLTVLLYLGISGLFTSIVVRTAETKYGPMVIAYKTITGPYNQVGALYTDSYCLLPKREQIGIYYDDPNAVSAKELRCAVGPILSNGDEQPVKEEMELMRSHGWRIFHIPRPSYTVTTTFPFRTTFSIFIAIYRVYPRLGKYIAEHSLCAYPAIEVYTDNEITFIMPLSRQEDFYVSEFQEESVSVATTEMGSVMGDKDTVSRTTAKPDEDDLFLKPKTPVRSNNYRAALRPSLDDSIEDDDDASAESKDNSIGDENDTGRDDVSESESEVSLAAA